MPPPPGAGRTGAGVPQPPERQPIVPGRASVRQPAGRSPARLAAPSEPATGSARVGAPPLPPAGKHVAPGLLPSRLSVQRALRLQGRTLPVIFGLVLVLVGSLVLGGSYFVDSVGLNTEIALPETTQVLFSDGSVMAKLGQSTRYDLPYDHIEDNVKLAIVASEDQSFWQNQGVDAFSIMRAAWNNFRGGQTQGGSTITQQYARLVYGLTDETYQRKAKEAVLAWKINRAMSKEQILGAYLNAVPFGRQAYGVEAAARAFFGKTADNTAPQDQQLTMAEAIALVELVKQPYPDPADPTGSPGYDPTVSDAAMANAHSRFDYVKGQLVKSGKISQQDADALKYPDPPDFHKEQQTDNGLAGPNGLIVNQVLSELTHAPGSPFNGAKDWTFLKEGGYQIYTTIDPGAQAAAIKAASRSQGTIMNSQNANLQAALVAVQPGTGRVIAYYGGDSGTGADYAGVYTDENGILQGYGYHPPGSSFKVYTLAAALKAGYSLKSYWDWANYAKMPDGNTQIHNASTCGNQSQTQPCSLLDSTINSLNVPFYRLTLSVGPANVLQMARDAGITTMWNDAREPSDLTQLPTMSSVVPSQFDTHLGIGQYSVTVLDHANGLATIAAGGLHANAHFVVKVMKGQQIVYGETLPSPTATRILTPQEINDETYALSQVSSAQNLNMGWDTAGKTGTWEDPNVAGQNLHAWMVGFDRNLAAAVWIGNSGTEQPVTAPNGSPMYGSMQPASIWRQFMIGATAAMNPPKVNTKFNPPNYGGDTNPPGSVPSRGNPQDQPGFPTKPTRTR
jgi:membrane peptidoglycan carboxypeptidase